MKVALVILHADASLGGAERYTLDVARALAERGHDVDLIAGSHAGDSASQPWLPILDMPAYSRHIS